MKSRKKRKYLTIFIFILQMFICSSLDKETAWDSVILNVHIVKTWHLNLEAKQVSYTQLDYASEFYFNTFVILTSCFWI